jgi:hypothetical protein
MTGDRTAVITEEYIINFTRNFIQHYSPRLIPCAEEITVDFEGTNQVLVSLFAFVRY